jgi:hypothetical protein
MHRPIEQWKEIFKGLSAEQAAKRLLGDVTGYRHGLRCEPDDIAEIASALSAWSQLLLDVVR